MKKLIILIFTVGIVSNCTNDGMSNVNIRVSNSSELNFENIVVDPGASENVDFGNLDSGMFSDYKNFEKAYRYGFVELTANGETYSIIPIDYVGESPLRNGNYTYALELVEREGDNTVLMMNLIQE